MDFQDTLISRWALLRWKVSNFTPNRHPHQNIPAEKRSWKFPNLFIPIPKQQFFLGTRKFQEN